MIRIFTTENKTENVSDGESLGLRDAKEATKEDLRDAGKMYGRCGDLLIELLMLTS